jgi:hypothetical protein
VILLLKRIAMHKLGLQLTIIFLIGAGGLIVPLPAIGHIQLAPLSATNTVGAGHTVTATVTLGGNPAANIGVTFEVLAGPNIGEMGTATTNVSGIASFTYTGDGGVGIDEIQASLVNSSTDELIVSNIVTKNWLALLGDINGNGRLDADDAQLILAVLVGLNPPTAVNFAASGDVNADDRINNLDSILILAIAEEQLPPPPDQTRITVVDSGGGTVIVAGATGTVPSGSSVNLTNATSGISSSVAVVADDGSFVSAPIVASLNDRIIIDVNGSPARIAVTVGNTFPFILDVSRLDDASQRIQ